MVKAERVFLILGWITISVCLAQDLEQDARGLKIVGATAKEVNAGRKVQLWAVVIGVSRYKLGDQTVHGTTIPNLEYAATDAQSIYDFLRSPEGGGFVPQSEGGHLVLLTDEQATKANVEKALAGLKQSRTDDYFVIYIASHGSNVPITNRLTKKTESVPYFFVYDSDPDDVPGTAVRMQAFQDALKQIPARRGLVLSDTCHSAGVQLAGRGLHVVETKEANGALIDAVKDIEGIGFISAAEHTELSLEDSNLGHGVFTYCLLEGFRGAADADRNQYVTFGEMRNYLRDEVPKLTDGKQHPFVNTTSIEAFDIPLAFVSYPKFALNGAAANFMGQLVVRAPDINGVAMAIDGEPAGMLNPRSERTFNVPAGKRALTFSKGPVKQDCSAEVVAGKSKYVEVNIAFSKDEGDDLDGPNEGQLNVFLDQEKEPSREVTELYQKGVDSFNKQKFDKAIDYLSRAFQASGNTNADVLVFLGRAQQSRGRDEAAAKSFEAALKIRPSDYQTRTLLAEARMKAGANLDEVAQELRAIIQSHKNDALARTVYADVLLKQIARLGPESESLRQSYFFEAEKNARDAIRIKPLSPPAHIVLADILTYQVSKVKQRQAVEAAERAVQLLTQLSQKQMSVAHGVKRLSLSHIIFGGGRYLNNAAMAEAHYLAAKSINNLCNGDDAPPDSAALLERAVSHIQEALKLAQATGDNLRLMLVRDVSAKTNYLKADDAAAIRDAERALRLIERTPRLDIMDYAEPYYILSLAYENQQKFGKAFDCLQRYLELEGPSLPLSDRLEKEDRLKRLKRDKEANRQ